MVRHLLRCGLAILTICLLWGRKRAPAVYRFRGTQSGSTTTRKILYSLQRGLSIFDLRNPKHFALLWKGWFSACYNRLLRNQRKMERFGCREELRTESSCRKAYLAATLQWRCGPYKMITSMTHRMPNLTVGVKPMSIPMPLKLKTCIYMYENKGTSTLNVSCIICGQKIICIPWILETTMTPGRNHQH